MASPPDDNIDIETEPAALEPQPIVKSAADLRRMIFLISVGLFITSTGQPGVIGALPFLPRVLTSKREGEPM